MWRLFEVQTSRLLFNSALPQCGDYSRAATIRSTDVAATIYFSVTAMRRLFEGGYYSKCGIYSRKYGIRGIRPVRVKFWWVSKSLTVKKMVFTVCTH